MTLLSRIRVHSVLFVFCAILLTPSAAAQSAIIRGSALSHPEVGDYGAVSTQHYLASRTGAKILRQGGNAVDAAVATALTLTAVLPRAGNLGGGGFMLVYLAEEDRTIAIDYREVAPAQATRDMFLDSNGEVVQKRSRYSPKAAGVPGTVYGLWHALTKYGTMSWKDVSQDAIRYARHGFELHPEQADAFKRATHLGDDPESRRIFLRNWRFYEVGERFVQPDLAKTLQLMADKGPIEAFYHGEIGRAIHDQMIATDGLITINDLRAYRAVERTPVTTTFRDADIYLFPLPSSGGVMIKQMLSVLDRFDLDAYSPLSADWIHVLAETTKLSFADRSAHMGDPEFWDVPTDWLTSRKYTASLARSIDMNTARPASDIRPSVVPHRESPDTTHFSIVDRHGNAVSNTYTLNFSFGSGIMLKGFGFLLNNEMDDFAARPGTPNAYGLLGGDANAVEPMKRPLSSMTPVIAVRDGRPALVTGSPGGSRIISAVLHNLIRVFVHGDNLKEAVSAPRTHHQWAPDAVFVERGVSTDTIDILRKRGHHVEVTRTIGAIQSVGMIADGVFLGASDPRRPTGRAIGVQAPKSQKH